MHESADEIYNRVRERIEAEEEERIRPEIERHERRMNGIDALKEILEAKLEKADKDRTMSIRENTELHMEIFPQIRALERASYEEWHEIGNLMSLKWSRVSERAEKLPELEALKNAYVRACAVASGLEMVRDYQNGHVTEFDENGEVLYEKV